MSMQDCKQWGIKESYDLTCFAHTGIQKYKIQVGRTIVNSFYL